MKRREFLRRAAAGGAIVTMPAFLAGCGVQAILPAATPVPENPFLDWFAIDQSVINQLMSAVTANGADIADLYFQHSRRNSLRLEEGQIGPASIDVRQGVGMRAVVGEQTGFASTEDLTLPSMLTAAGVAAAKTGGVQPVLPQNYESQPLGDLYTSSIMWADIGAEQIQAKLEFVEQQVRLADPAIRNVSVHWEDNDDKIMIATLSGSLVMDDRPMARLTVVATAERDGEVQTGFATIAARADVTWFSETRLRQTIDEVVERTMIQFDARRAPLGEMPVILASGSSGVLLHEAIGHSMEADLNQSGASAFADRIGEKIAEPFVSIIDQADIPNEPGALNYDDEGNSAGRTVMVENGVLRSYLHDEVSAQRSNVESTASGRRESYRHAPMPRMSCTFMDDGPHTKDEIVAAVDRGIICETYVDGKVQLGVGDFSFGIKNGWLVEKGKITAPIKDVSISGNGPETLARMSMVANDSRLDAGGWTCGKNGQNVPVSQGMPTVLVSAMTVGPNGTT